MKRMVLAICAILMLLLGALGTSTLLQRSLIRVHASSGGGDWPMYMGNAARTGADTNETIITPATAQSLAPAWKFTTGGWVVASPAIVANVMYIGSWDGYEYAIDLATHQQLWRSFLGVATQTNECCHAPSVGVTSTAAVQNNVVYVGGGDGYLYALDASTGAVIWKTLLGAPPYYNWSSPVVYNNRVYTGLAAFGDPPYMLGKIVALNIGDGSLAASVSLAPSGMTGATVWSSLAVDASTNRIYAATGNPGGISAALVPYSESFLALDANSLQVLDHWQIPLGDQANDVDFGATPVLFDVNGAHYIGDLNKNGIYYVLNRSNLAAGPIWKQNLVGLPITQGDNVSSACYNNGVLYTGSGLVQGTNIGGTVHAFDAVTGKQIWSANTGQLEASLTCTNGLVIDNQASTVEVRNASTGAVLFHYATGKQLLGSSVVSNGVLYTPSTDMSIYAFTLSGGPTSTPTPTATTIPPVSGPVSKQWYFAEGRTGAGFKEFLTLGNPTNTPCQVNITYLTQPDSGTGGTKSVSVSVPASRRVTEWVDGDLGTSPSGPGISDAAIVSVNSTATPACTGIVAERPMYFNALGTNGGSDVVGVTHTGTTFYFADLPVGGQPGGGTYSSFLPILNPGSTAAKITATYYANGQQVGTQTLTVAPNSRGTIFPSSASPSLPSRVSVILTSTQPVVSERPTYFSNINGGNAGIVSGGADVSGVQNLANDWLFAEGYTGGQFQENFAIANLDPVQKAATVTITLEYNDGSSHPFTLTVNPHSQVIWNVNTNGTGATSQSVSAEIKSAGANIVVQREMFFRYNHVGNGRTLTAIGGTDVLGQVGPAAATAYSFAEGYTNTGYDEWLTIQNPTVNTETITATLANAVGTVYTFTVTIVGHSRYTVDIVAIVMRDMYHNADGYNGYEASMAVQSRNGPFVVERPMYWNASGTQGGSDVIGFSG